MGWWPQVKEAVQVEAMARVGCCTGGTMQVKLEDSGCCRGGTIQGSAGDAGGRQWLWVAVARDEQCR